MKVSKIWWWIWWHFRIISVCETGSGAPEIRLSTDKQAVLFDSQYDVTRSFITYRDEVKVGSQHNFKLIQAEQDYFGDSALRYSLPNVLVIQDEAYQQIKGFTYTIAYLQTEKVQTDALTQLLDEELPIEWAHPLTYEFSDDQKRTLLSRDRSGFK